VRLARFRAPFDVEIVEVKAPKPGPEEVLIRVRACAICASDKAIIEGGNPNPGHEIAGEVVEVGGGVKDIKPGQRVTLYWKVGCGECGFCKEGWEVHCQSPRYLAWNGYADYILAHERACLPLPEGLDFIEGSLLTDTVGTPLSAVLAAGVEGKRVAVWGCGPLGLVAVRLSKVRGAKAVAALDPLPSRREVAREFGADLTVNPEEEDPVAVLREFAPPLGPEASICATRAEGTADLALSATAPGGRLVLIAGEQRGTGEHIWIMRVLYFRRDVYPEILRVASEGLVPLRRLVTHIFPLDKLAEAFDLRFNRPWESLKVVVAP